VQTAEADVVERERLAQQQCDANATQQEQHDAMAADLEHRSSEVAQAAEELRTLKVEMESLIKSVGSGVESAAEAESRAVATWDLVREHVATIAADGRVSVDTLSTPAIEVCIFRTVSGLLSLFSYKSCTCVMLLFMYFSFVQVQGAALVSFIRCVACIWIANHGAVCLPAAG
jgi:hypothetical protein